MPCYHPRILIKHLNRPYKNKEGGTSFRTTIEQPDDLLNRLEDLKASSGNFHYYVIPCQQCIGCRLDYSREWANRGYLESKLWQQNWFCTITYDDDHIFMPEEMTDSNDITFTDDGDWKGCLVPKDLTQFIKNVRQIMKREYNQDKIRFMASGEYGGEGERPHYHIIFFNLNLPVEDLHHPKIINHEIYYESHIIDRAWGGERYLDKARKIVNPNSKGIANISDATWNNIAYTARYITKKLNGQESDTIYASKGQIKEFFRVSRMPGIGEGYYQKHWEEIYEKDEIIIKNKEGIVSSKPPKYFDRLFERDHPWEFKEIKRRRQEANENSEKIKDQTISVGRLARLEIEENLNEDKHLKLVRMMEKGVQ